MLSPALCARCAGQDYLACPYATVKDAKYTVRVVIFYIQTNDLGTSCLAWSTLVLPGADGLRRNQRHGFARCWVHHRNRLRVGRHRLHCLHRQRLHCCIACIGTGCRAWLGCTGVGIMKIPWAALVLLLAAKTSQMFCIGTCCAYIRWRSNRVVTLARLTAQAFRRYRNPANQRHPCSRCI